MNLGGSGQFQNPASHLSEIPPPTLKSHKMLSLGEVCGGSAQDHTAFRALLPSRIPVMWSMRPLLWWSKLAVSRAPEIKSATTVCRRWQRCINIEQPGVSKLITNNRSPDCSSPGPMLTYFGKSRAWAGLIKPKRPTANPPPVLQSKQVGAKTYLCCIYPSNARHARRLGCNTTK